MSETIPEKTQEDINDESASREVTGNPKKQLKNEMMRWVQAQVAKGKRTKTTIVVSAEKKFGIPYRTTSGLHDEEMRPEEEPPPSVLVGAKKEANKTKKEPKADK